MLRSSQEAMKIPGSAHCGSREVCVFDDRRFAAVFSASGAATLASFLSVSVSGVKNLMMTFGGCTWEWRIPSRFSLSKALSGDWTSSRVKI
jgi:hypothetical protein